MTFLGFNRRARLASQTRRRSSRSVALHLSVLEKRELMAAGPLGLNLNGTLGYVDLIKETQGWTPLTASTLPTDAEGWPLADARVTVLDDRTNQSYNGPDPNAAYIDIGGTYHLSFQGQAAIDPDYLNNYTVANQVYNVATNTTTADLVVPHFTYPMMLINFRHTVNPASSTGAGVADVQLIQPGYDAGTTQLFTNNMVNDLSPFSTLRTLDVDGANNYGIGFTNSYQNFTTSSFDVAAGSHVISFVGAGGPTDVAAFLDTVSIANVSGILPQVTGGAVPTVGDSGFEDPSVNYFPGYQYNPTGTPWTFAGQAGVTANASGFTTLNPNAPQGSQVAFLQGQGTISQTLSFAGGSYQINFAAMQRNGYAGQTIKVLVDGTQVGTFTPPVSNPTSTDWSQRKLPDASSQVSGPGAPGEAWEYIIALANQSNKDLWINIPATANDGYIAQLANLIKNGDTIDGVTYKGLNSNLKVYLEYSNEVWGGTYNNFLHVIAAAQLETATGTSTLNNDGTTDGYTLSQRYYLERTMEATNIFRSVLGADPTFSKIRPVLGGPQGNIAYFTTLLPWFERSYGAPSQYFYGMGATNYENPTDYSSVDNLIASLYTGIAQESAQTAIYATVANYYGLHTVAYEGGAGTSGATTDAGKQISLAASRDPRMEDVYKQLYSTWFAAGGGLAAVYDGPYAIYTPDNQAAIMELSEAGNPTASPKFRGLADLSPTAAQTVTAGTPVALNGTSKLSVTSDSLGQSFTSPTAGQTNYWLLNVAVGGSYNVILQTGSGTANGKVTISLGDQTSVGTYSVSPSGTDNLVAISLHPGLNTLAITTLSPFNVVALSLSPAIPTLIDSGFEQTLLPSGYYGFTYNPQGSGWTYTGSAGVSGNASGFTASNPNAPEGGQVAFLQNLGTISQTTTIYSATNYQIHFSAAQRGIYNTSNQIFQVLVDGVLVGKFNPSSSAYQTFSSPSIALTAGPHTISFHGLNASGDATAFIDAVSITQASAAPLFGDASFEQVSLPSGYYGFAYNPQGSAWTFAGSAGVTGNASGFTSSNSYAPDGTQVAFLQNQGSITQTLNNVPAGNYSIGFDLAQRANYGSLQTIQIMVDGVLMGTYTSTTVTYQALTTATFALTAGSHTVVIKGMNASGDATAFVDAVTLNPVSSS